MVLPRAPAKAEVIVLNVANGPFAHAPCQVFQLNPSWLVGLIKPGGLCSGV
jgi:hypothetical protein